MSGEMSVKKRVTLLSLPNLVDSLVQLHGLIGASE